MEIKFKFETGILRKVATTIFMSDSACKQNKSFRSRKQKAVRKDYLVIIFEETIMSKQNKTRS